jgi:DNA-binding GntR family transcriptional regulator
MMSGFMEPTCIDPYMQENGSLVRTPVGQPPRPSAFLAWANRGIRADGYRHEAPQGQRLRAGPTRPSATRILSLELAPGKDLDEQELIASLGVSRTRRSAKRLIQLAAEGLVELLPNRGARIAKIDLPGVREFFEALDANQRMVTRWAALRHTKDDLRRIDEGDGGAFDAAVASGHVGEMMSTNLAFHEAIAAACGNALSRTQLQPAAGLRSAAFPHLACVRGAHCGQARHPQGRHRPRTHLDMLSATSWPATQTPRKSHGPPAHGAFPGARPGLPAGEPGR